MSLLKTEAPADPEAGSSRGLPSRWRPLLRTPDRRLLLATLCLALVASTPPSEADEIRGLIKASRFAEAEDRARALCTENETTHGPRSLETARALDLLVEAMWRGGRGHLPEARELAERAVDIKERAAAVEERERASRVGGTSHTSSRGQEIEPERTLYSNRWSRRASDFWVRPILRSLSR